MREDDPPIPWETARRARQPGVNKNVAAYLLPELQGGIHELVLSGFAAHLDLDFPDPMKGRGGRRVHPHRRRGAARDADEVVVRPNKLRWLAANQREGHDREPI